MKKNMILTFIALILFSEISLAQYQSRAVAPSTWRRSTAIILFSGIGGSLLGLSTLSFYGNPKEHTNNITIGALLGVIGGTSWVIRENSQQIKAPVKTYDYYGLFPSAETLRPPTTVASVPTLQFDFTF